MTIPTAGNHEARTATLSSVDAAVFLREPKIIVGMLTNCIGILAEAAHSSPPGSHLRSPPCQGLWSGLAGGRDRQTEAIETAIRMSSPARIVRFTPSRFSLCPRRRPASYDPAPHYWPATMLHSQSGGWTPWAEAFRPSPPSLPYPSPFQCRLVGCSPAQIPCGMCLRWRATARGGDRLAPGVQPGLNDRVPAGVASARRTGIPDRLSVADWRTSNPARPRRPSRWIGRQSSSVGSRRCPSA